MRPPSVVEEEIRALQLVQRSSTAKQPSCPRAGQTMRVTAGPLAGVNGTLIEIHGAARLVLSVTILQRSILIEIDRNWVTYDSLLPQIAP